MKMHTYPSTCALFQRSHPENTYLSLPQGKDHLISFICGLYGFFVVVAPFSFLKNSFWSIKMWPERQHLKWRCCSMLIWLDFHEAIWPEWCKCRPSFDYGLVNATLISKAQKACLLLSFGKYRIQHWGLFIDKPGYRGEFLTWVIPASGGP